MNDLFETLSAKTRMHYDLVNAGIPSEQATAIAFNCEKEPLIKVQIELFNAAIRTAFLMGQSHELSACAGQAKESQDEAINRCVKEINLMVA